MATVNRPPFWVPRGDQQDTVWYAQPLKSPIIPFLTQQKIYGAGGQVPTKRWLPYLTYDDPPMWQGAPLNSGAIMATKTQVKIYGQPGQAPTKRWLPYLLYDDPPMWQGSPLNSGAIMATKTQVKIFGQPGQGPTKNWLPYLLYDDASYWSGAPIKSPIISFLTQQKIFGAGGQVPPFRPNFTYDDASPWQWPLYERNRNVLFPPINPFANWQWRWYDEASGWNGSPLNSAAIPLLTQQTLFGQGGQVPPFRPNFTLDDPPMWQGAPRAAVSLNIPGIRFYGQIGQVPPFRPNFTYDDASYWLGKPVNSALLQQLLTAPVVYGQGGQAPPFRWNYTYDDPGFWTGEPLNSAAIPLLTQQKVFGQGGQVPPYRWNYTLDDPPSWSPTVERNLILLQPSAAPFSNRQWQWSDDAAIWQGTPTWSATITLSGFHLYSPRSSLYFWRTYLDDWSTWQWPLYERNPNVLQPSGEPFNNYKNFWYSEDAWWNARPVSSAAIPLLTQQKIFGQGGQVPPYRWNYTLDDPPPWQWPAYERNLNALQPSGEPFSIRQPTWYSEDSFWQGAPLTRNPNVLQPSAEPFNNYKTYWYSEDSFWQGAPRNSGAIITTKTQVTIYGQPGQVPPFRPNFTYDDASPWQWPLYERNPNVLTPSGKPFSNYKTYWYSDDAFGSFWQGSPTALGTMFLDSFVLFAPRNNWNIWWVPLEQETFWQGSPLNSRPITLTTTQGKFYSQPGQVPPFRPNFTLDDPPMWQGSPIDSRAIIVTTTQGKFYGRPGQTPPFRWNYTIDIPPMWQGVPASFNYLLTQPLPPKPSGNDWIDFRRRARRR